MLGASVNVIGVARMVSGLAQIELGAIVRACTTVPAAGIGRLKVGPVPAFRPFTRHHTGAPTGTPTDADENTTVSW